MHIKEPQAICMGGLNTKEKEINSNKIKVSVLHWPHEKVENDSRLDTF